jgi:hypothetical protein
MHTERGAQHFRGIVIPPDGGVLWEQFVLQPQVVVLRDVHLGTNGLGQDMLPSVN